MQKLREVRPGNLPTVSRVGCGVGIYSGLAGPTVDI